MIDVEEIGKIVVILVGMTLANLIMILIFSNSLFDGLPIVWVFLPTFNILAFWKVIVPAFSDR